MILGIGLDVCEIARMEKNLEDERFLRRFFTEAEGAYVRSRGKGAAQTLAGMFAAKEALGKALGGGLDFELCEAEIVHDENGCPGYALTGVPAERTRGERLLLSITHDGGVAAAMCVREGGSVKNF